MYKKLLTAFCLVLILLAGNVTAGWIHWTGAVSSNWHDVGNWDLGRLPTMTDYVGLGTKDVTNMPVVNYNAAFRASVGGPIDTTLQSFWTELWTGTGQGTTDVTLTIADGATFWQTGDAYFTLGRNTAVGSATCIVNGGQMIGGILANQEGTRWFTVGGNGTGSDHADGTLIMNDGLI